ncbi:putative BAH domain-containing protein [Rosa chinensis]|uniref:Putative BAH domain-containing protein n=1 Tax=Rosa chinensis TaxID=74649 RepID=A0A2P6PCR0_ROSCH|nr:chromatin remodeling protein SHL [Rosa chinensis]PRQ19711.1 putative BAH domain-containing protein [Rosa chinensis]
MGFSNSCSIRDYVLLKVERGKIPYIARIHQIYISCEDVSQEVHLKVQWFYRLEDTQMKCISFNGKNELYKSNHYDYYVPADSILNTCSVRSFKSYIELPDADENVFFTRYTYDNVAKKFEDADVDVYVTLLLF